MLSIVLRCGEKLRLFVSDCLFEWVRKYPYICQPSKELSVSSLPVFLFVLKKGRDQFDGHFEKDFFHEKLKEELYGALRSAARENLEVFFKNVHPIVCF